MAGGCKRGRGADVQADAAYPLPPEREGGADSQVHARALLSTPAHHPPPEGSREARPLLAPNRASRAGPPLTLRASLRTRRDTPLPPTGPPRAVAPLPHAGTCRSSRPSEALVRVPRSVRLRSHSPSPPGSWPEVSGGTENPERRRGSPERGLRGRAAARSEVNAWPARLDPRGAGSRRSRLAGLLPVLTSVSGRRNRGSRRADPPHGTAEEGTGRVSVSQGQ